MSRLTRDGTAEPVSRDQILRHARGHGNMIFPVQLTTSRIGNLTRLIHTLLYVMTIYILQVIVARVQTWSPSTQICSSSNTQHVLLCIQIDTAAQYCSYTRSFRCPLRTKRPMPTLITIHIFMQSYYCLISRPRNHNHIQMGTPRASKDWGMLRRSRRVPILPTTPTTPG